MKKFKCDNCGQHCVLKRDGEWLPKFCPSYWRATPEWKEIEPEQQPVKNDLTLPEWLKVGSWVYQTCTVDDKTGYGKIVAIGANEMRVDYIDGRIEMADLAPGRLSMFREARLRQWTFEEAQVFVKAFSPATHAPEAFRLGRSATAPEEIRYYDLSQEYHSGITLQEMRNFVQLDGRPCGVLEYKNDNWEWVE